MKFAMHHPVTCADGADLELGDLVIDPVARTVTHVAVQPGHHHDEARLVPVSMLGDIEGEHGALMLRCTEAEFAAMPAVAAVSVIDPAHRIDTDEGWTVGTSDVVPMAVGDPMLGAGWVDDQVTIRWDRIPEDEVEVRRSSGVYSSDEHRLGRLDGVVCDRTGAITEVIAKHGILFGRRNIIVPIDCVDRFENDVIVLNLTKDQAGSLEAQPLDDWLEEPTP